MPLFEYPFTRDITTINTGQLSHEITTSSITVALEKITSENDDLSVFFKAEISSAELTTLSGIVNSHIKDPNFDPPLILSGNLDSNNQVVGQKLSPSTPDGETHTVQSNLGKITGNETINWTMNYSLNAGSSIDERFVVPSGTIASIEFVQGYSPSIEYSVELNWYIRIRAQAIRRNPAMRQEHFWIQEVDGNHPAPTNVVKLKNANGFQFSGVEINKVYGFATSSGTSFLRQVTAKNGPQKEVTLNTDIPSDLLDGDKFGLVDRPIAKLGGTANNALMDFEVAPTFRGDGERYLELVLRNESLLDSGEVFAVVNGWVTPAVSGTIPGKGGGEKDEA